MAIEALDPRIFQEVSRLNGAFLRLLGHCEGTAVGRLLDRGSGMSRRLLALEPEQVEILCTTRSALFTLVIHPGELPAQGVAEDPPGVERGPEWYLAREFSLVAACFAWHLSQTSTLAAALALGWSRERVLALAEQPLTRVVQATRARAPGVHLKMFSHASFWDDLIRCVCHPNRRTWEVASIWSAQFISTGS